jgi:hypothetical protein
MIHFSSRHNTTHSIYNIERFTEVELVMIHQILEYC